MTRISLTFIYFNYSFEKKEKVDLLKYKMNGIIPFILYFTTINFHSVYPRCLRSEFSFLRSG